MTRSPGELHEFLSHLSAKNTAFHDAVLSILTAVLMDKDASDCGNFLDIIELIEKKRLAQSMSNQMLADALMTIETYIRQEMTAVALSFHDTLKKTRGTSLQLPDKKNLPELGIGSEHKISVGFPQGSDLLELSYQYMKAKQDLDFLNTHFKNRFQDLFADIKHIKTEAGKLLYDVAWTAASHIAANAATADLAEFRIIFQKKDRSLLAAARDSLNRISIPGASSWPADVIQNVDAWVCQFGSTAFRMLNDLYHAHGRPLLEVLAFSCGVNGLDALYRLSIKPEHKDAIFLLTALRFGELKINTIAQWQEWLEKEVMQITHRKEAIRFFENHPALIADLFASLNIPKSLSMTWQKQIKPADKETFLNRRQSLLTPEMHQTIEETFAESDEPNIHVEAADAGRTTSIETDNHTSEPPEPEGKAGKEEHHVFEGIMDAGVDTVMGDDPMEAGLNALLDQGLGVLGEKLTVSIEMEEETPIETEPVTEPEPEKSIWYDYVKPLIYKNLFFIGVAGAIFSGLLILVFALWDRNAVIRYGLTPLLVVGVSFALTRIGLWLNRIDIESATPVTILQSVSIFLAPLSLLFVGLMAVDAGLSGVVRIIGGVVLSSVLLVSWYFIIMFSITLVYKNVNQVHTRILLFLNALLLLLPAAQLAVKYGSTELLVGAKTILVIGFYAGFTALIVSSNRILDTMTKNDGLGTSTRLSFYCITSLGTFSLVWGLTHARLGMLPSIHTYGPLFILCGFFFSLVEFKTTDLSVIRGKTSPLTFLTYSLVILGIILSISHPIIRSVSLFLAGGVWFYIGLKLREEKHFGISLVILILSFTSLIMTKAVPDYFLPVSGILIAICLYMISLKTSIKELSDPAGRLCSIFLIIIFIATIMWQWLNPFPPFFCGISFICYGFILIYLGAQKDILLHIHTGAVFLVAAIPYLGFADMQNHILNKNTIVFGLGLLSIGWTVFSSVAQNTTIKDSRSTVLWGICMFALSIIGLNFLITEPLIASQGTGYRIMTITGPMIISSMLILSGYYTRSYVPVYAGLLVMVPTVLEVKAQFGISMYSGLGKTIAGIGMLAGIPLLKKWPVINDLGPGDMIWRKKSFPYQATGHQLYTTPLMISALMILSLVLFYNYPKNLFFSIRPFTFKTALAVVFSGVAFHYFSVRFKNPLPSYIGYTAILLGMVNLYFTRQVYDVSSGFWPFTILAVILLWEGTGKAFSGYSDKEQIIYILKPLRVMKYIVIWTAALILYEFYSICRGGYFFWIPLFLYICFLAARECMNRKSRLMLIPMFLLMWQTITLIFTGGTAFDNLLSRQSIFPLMTALMVLGSASSFFYLERSLSEKSFNYYVNLLLISLVPTICFSLLLYGNDAVSFPDFRYPALQLAVWAPAMFIMGRFLNLSPLWLAGAMSICLLILPDISGFNERFEIFVHPFTLVIISVILSLLVQLSSKYPGLYRYKFSRPWSENKILTPSFFLSSSGQVFIGIAIYLAIFDSSHIFTWCAVSALFAGAFTEIFFARALSFSRRYLFFLLYTPACIYFILLMKHHYPDSMLFFRLSDAQLMGFGFMLSLITALVADRLIRYQENNYQKLKYTLGLCIAGLAVYAYFSSGIITQRALSYLTATGLLMLSAALFFRFFTHNRTIFQNYIVFACSLFFSFICFETAIFRSITGYGPNATAVYIIISIPCFWFYIRSEIRRMKEKTYTQARITATILLIVLTAIYVFPGLSELLLFPSPAITPAPYRNTAVIAIIAGLALTRMHALGAGPYVVYGGLGIVVTAIFFLLSKFIPSVSLPYEIRYALILCVTLSVVFLSIVQSENRLKKTLSWFGNIDMVLWENIRSFLYIYFLLAGHTLLIISLFYPADTALQSIVFLMLAGLWIFTAHHYNRCLINYFGCSMVLMAVYAKQVFSFSEQATAISVPWLLLTLLVFMIPCYIYYLRHRFIDAEVHYHIWTAVIAGLIVFESLSYFRSVDIEMMIFMIVWGASVLLIPVSASYAPKTGFKVFLGFLLYFPIAFLFLLQALLPNEFTIKIFLTATAMSCVILAYRSLFKQTPLDTNTGILKIYHHLHHYMTSRTSWSLVILQGVWTFATIVLFLLTYQIYYADEPMMVILLFIQACIWIFLGNRYRKPAFNHIAFGLMVAAIISFRSSRILNEHLFLATAFLFLYILLLLFHRLYLKNNIKKSESYTHKWALFTAILVLAEYAVSFDPYDYISLIIPIILWFLILGTPCSNRYKNSIVFRIFLGIMCYVPIYGVYIFRASPDLTALTHAVLAMVLIAFLIKDLETGRIKMLSNLSAEGRNRHIADHMYGYIRKPDKGLTILPQVLATLCLLVIHVIFYLSGHKMVLSDLLIITIIQILLGIYWFRLAKEERFWFWTVTAQAVFFGLIITIRRALPDMLGFEWTDNLDVMAGLVIAFTITASKPLLQNQTDAVQKPVRFTLFGLPIATAIYAFTYDVGFDVIANALLLYSILFTMKSYNEKDRLVLAYSFLGYNAYLVIMFLHYRIHSFQAYLTPVCLSTLVLTQVFRDITSGNTANIVRGLTLTILLGTALVQVISDNLLSPQSHLILLLLSILSMIFARLLRIKIFAIAGFFSFIIDIIAVIYIVLVHRDAETLKIILGLSLTLGGGICLTGYILYRKNKGRIDGVMNKYRTVFSTWE